MPRPKRFGVTPSLAGCAPLAPVVGDAAAARCHGAPRTRHARRSPALAEPARARGGAQGVAQVRVELLIRASTGAEALVPCSTARKAAAHKTVFAASKSAPRSARPRMARA